MSSDNQQPKEKAFHVVDKRRFAADGQERTAETTTTQPGEQLTTRGPTTANAATTAPTSDASSPQFTMHDETKNEEAEPVAFTSFIMSLATQVLVQLGEMPAPNGMEIPIDLESARQTIDIMTMLQRRTKGNLSSDESRFMEEVLHSLRISFINAKNKTS